MEPSVKRTADAFGIGIATVKRVMADFNRDPKLLDEPAKMRGPPRSCCLVHHIKKLFGPMFDQQIKKENI